MECPVKPVFACPRFINNIPTVREVYFYQPPGTLYWEVTVVFEREDLPDPTLIGNALFQLYHEARWHRKQDLESFYVMPSGSAFALYFQDSYSDKSYLGSFTEADLHQEKRLPMAESFHMYNGQADCPIVYVSTWNHAFCERDTNPVLLKVYNVPATNYTVLQGSRADVEAKYRTQKWWYPKCLST